jgi:hypothetical protein
MLLDSSMLLIVASGIFAIGACPLQQSVEAVLDHIAPGTLELL